MKNMIQASYAIRKKYIVSCKEQKIILGTKTILMGIVNITPDSFSQDGLLKRNNASTHNVVSYALKLIKEGANIIDIGGESSRPGSTRISTKEEINRIIPAIRQLKLKTKIPISVDTYKPAVAEKALDAGACIVNNIRGAQLTKSMLKVIKKYRAATILMHMRGTPKTMQKNIFYKDVLDDIIKKLKISIEKCFENGIESDKIIIDPGIGFGKTTEHNIEIIRRLKELQCLNKPILIGASRKSFIGEITQKDVGGRIMGTAASVCAAIAFGAHILRIHDIASMKDVALVADTFFTKTKHDNHI